jgi:hypothetical protein
MRRRLRALTAALAVAPSARAADPAVPATRLYVDLGSKAKRWVAASPGDGRSAPASPAPRRPADLSFWSRATGRAGGTAASPGLTRTDEGTEARSSRARVRPTATAVSKRAPRPDSSTPRSPMRLICGH